MAKLINNATNANTTNTKTFEQSLKLDLKLVHSAYDNYINSNDAVVWNNKDNAPKVSRDMNQKLSQGYKRRAYDILKMTDHAKRATESINFFLMVLVLLNNHRGHT